MLRCLGEHETVLVLAEVRKWAYKKHIGRKDFSHKLLRKG